MSEASPEDALVVDPLSSVLASLRLHTAHCARVELGGSWAVEVAPVAATQLHVLVQGSIWLEPQEEPGLELAAGATWLVPHGASYRLGSGADVDPVPLAEVEQAIGYVRARGSGEPGATLLCMECDLGPRATDPLAGALPSCILSEQTPPALSELVSLLDRTLRKGGSGSALIADRLAELCLLGFLRDWLVAPERAAETGWLAALGDPGLSRALGAMMAAPEAEHDLFGLARIAAMSRTRFASRFRQRVGLPPLAWLRRWRVQQAAQRLLDGETIEAAASAVGFASTSAFSRAFVREVGARPGEWARAHGRAQPAEPSWLVRAS